MASPLPPEDPYPSFNDIMKKEVERLYKHIEEQKFKPDSTQITLAEFLLKCIHTGDNSCKIVVNCNDHFERRYNINIQWLLNQLQEAYKYRELASIGLEEEPTCTTVPSDWNKVFSVSTNKDKII